VAEGDTTFAGLSVTGERLTYLKGGDLFSFDLISGTTTPIGSGGKSIPVNVSADGSHVYFVAAKALTGGGGPIAGQRNFYVWNAATGTIAFIAVLAPVDVSGEGGGLYALGRWVGEGGSIGYAFDPSRTTPDGRAIVFESHANLTGYQADGHAEVYRYAAGEEPHLSCLSCNPTLLPTTSDSHLQVLSEVEHSSNPGAPIRNITADGNRVFFQSGEPLAATDVDDLEDIYEWQAEGTGGCTRRGGCLSLITSRSSASNELYAVTPSGNDVFFATSDLLGGGDHDTTTSIYDARVGGGFPDGDPVPCGGEACKAQPQNQPPLLQPLSAAAGKTAAPKPCKKGRRSVRRHGKRRCVRRHGKHHRRHSGGRRGGSR
jgi:hypothetical protein